MTKLCKKCGSEKPLNEFYKDSSKKDGRRSHCIACLKSSYNPEYAKKRYQKNKDHVRARVKKWQADNAERFKFQQANWKRQNKDKRRGYNRTYREKLIPCKASQISARFEYYGGNCWMCGKHADTIDHVKPIHLGGLHIPANIRPACRSCNSSKGARWYGVDQLFRFLK
jgi:5-methylcytosine-specific restriction endonuclease McrA